MGRIGHHSSGVILPQPISQDTAAVAVDRQFHWRRPGRSVQSPPLLMSARTKTQLANAIGLTPVINPTAVGKTTAPIVETAGLEADEPISCACGRPLCSSEDEEWINRRECQPEQDDAPGSKHWLTRQQQHGRRHRDGGQCPQNGPDAYSLG